MASSREYLVDLLRDDMGFDGMLVTDYNEVRRREAATRLCVCVCIATYKDSRPLIVSLSLALSALFSSSHRSRTSTPSTSWPRT